MFTFPEILSITEGLVVWDRKHFSYLSSMSCGETVYIFLGGGLDINEPPFPLLLTQFYICFFHRSLTHPMIGLQYNYCLPPKGSSQKTNKLSRVTFQLFIGNSHEDFCFKVHSLSASCKIFLTNFPDLVPCRVRHINLFLPVWTYNLIKENLLLSGF